LAGVEEIGVAVRSGENNTASRLTAIKKHLIDELDSQVPQYGQARKIWSDDSGRLNALDAGLNIFKKNTRDVSLKEFKSMPDDQKELFRLGAARAIKKVIDQTSDTMTGEPGSRIFSTIFGDKETRQVLKQVFPDEASYNEFAKRMRSEKTFRENSNRAIRNSATARREAQHASDTGGAIADAIDAVDSPARVAIKIIRRVKPKRSDPATDKRIAEILTETDANAIKSALGAIADAPGWANGIKKMTPAQLQRWLKNPQNISRLESTLSGGSGSSAVAASR